MSNGRTAALGAANLGSSPNPSTTHPLVRVFYYLENIMEQLPVQGAGTAAPAPSLADKFSAVMEKEFNLAACWTI